MGLRRLDVIEDFQAIAEEHGQSMVGTMDSAEEGRFRPFGMHSSLDYITRRTTEGKSPREIKRCLVRYLARRVYRLLEAPTS